MNAFGYFLYHSKLQYKFAHVSHITLIGVSLVSRKNCFTTDYFKGCLDVLLLQDEMEKYQTWIKQLHGAEPGV